MTRFVLFISCFFLIDMIAECKKEGYLVGNDGCKYGCITRPHQYCVHECELKKGTDGYCAYWLACYCYNMPDWVPTWSSATNKCKGK
nr:putative NaTx Tcis46 [Tityus cisandinus]